MPTRAVFTLALSAILLVGGLLTPVAGAAQDVRSAPVHPTVTAEMSGLAPAAVQPRGPTDRGPSVMGTGRAQLSAPVATDIPFSLVGFDLPSGATVEFRTSVDGQRWTAWTHADVRPDEGPDPDSPEAEAARAAADRATTEPAVARATTEPVWVGEATWLQARTAGAGTQELDVHLVDSNGLGRSWAQRARDAIASAWDTSPPPAHAQADEPDIVTREEWGADESIRRDEPSYADRIRFGVVHHTAGRNEYSQAEAPAVVRGVYAYHVESNGWSDIGYNLLVDRFGTVYEGRSGGVERPVIGAHAGGFNTGSFGVAMIGSFEGGLPPEEAMDSLAEVLAWKFDVHHVDVQGGYEATSRGGTRWPEGTTVPLATLSGHRDVSATSCPGGALYAALPVVRDRMLELAGDVLLDHDAEPGRVRVVNGVNLDGPITFTTRLRPPGEWRLEVRDPSGAVVHTDEGEGSEATSTWSPAPAIARGDYTYEFSSDGRRSATDTVEFVQPTIDAEVAPEVVDSDDGGLLVEPVSFRATLWPTATWQVTVTSQDGDAPVFTQAGAGETLAVEWPGPVAASGTYGWRIEADDVDPVTGTITIARDVLDRIGQQPAAVAAAVAVSQETFPDDEEAEHAVLARADVFADAMAGGPLAGAAGPVLLTPGDRLDDAVADELERVLPEGETVYVLGGEAAIDDAVVAALDDRWEVERLAGSGRVETAVAVAEVVIDRTGAEQALVARAGPDSAAPWADAIAGGAWGANAGVPVLLTDGERLSPGTEDAIDRLDIAATVVLGGPSAISEDVVDDLPEPRRIQGQDRAGTAAAIAEDLWGRTAGADGDHIVLAPGYAPDAWTLPLVAAPLAARTGAPLLLANGEVLPPSTRAYLESLRYGDGRKGEGWVLGDETSVTESVADEVSSLLQ